MIRYLIVSKVNNSLCWFPNYPSIELSLVLGHAIAERLPTVQARKWYKALSSWEKYGGISFKDNRNFSRLPSSPWPLEAVLFPYPAKRNFGEGELIFWEIKLIGDDADHGLFLEAILPALEDIGHRKDSRWQYTNCLWGNFDIHSIYAAKGNQWEALVEGGRLNLNYKASPFQWSNDFVFQRKMIGGRDSITWISPFKENQQARRRQRKFQPPSLKKVLEAFIDRMSGLMLGKYYTRDDFWAQLNKKEQADLKEALEKSSHIPVIENDFKGMSSYYLHSRMGKQIFSTAVSDSIYSCLCLASIFHVGDYTHFGCGSFTIN